MDPSRSGDNPGGLAIAMAVAVSFAVLFFFSGPWNVGSHVVGRLTVAYVPGLLVLIGCAFVPSWRRALYRIARARWTAPGYTTPLLFLGASVFFLRVVVGLYRALMVNAWDFSAFELPVTRSWTQGFLFSPIEGRSFLGTHAAYLLAAFIAPYSLVETPYWLLAAHACALSGAVAVAYLVCRRLLRDDAAGLLMAAAFALNSYTAKIAQYPFHIEVFYPIVVLLLCLAVLENRSVLGIALFAVLLAIKEDAVLVALGLALVLGSARPRRFLAAAAVVVAGAAVYLVSTRLVMPAAAHTPPGQVWYSAFWIRYGPTPMAAARGLVAHPLQVAADLGRSGIGSLLQTFLFLPLVGIDWLLLALPALVVYGVADGGRSPIAQFSIYYSAPVIGVFVVAAAKGARRIAVNAAKRARDARLTRSRAYRRLAAAAVLLVSALDGPSYVLRAPRVQRDDVKATVRRCPSSTPLRIQGSLFPHAGYGLNLSPLAKLEATGREAFLLDPNSSPYPFTSKELGAFLDATSRDPRYSVFRSAHGLVLLSQARRERVAAEPRP